MAGNTNPQEEHLQYFSVDDLFSPFNHRRGLPIGNLTSQFWANVYMDSFDHFIKEVPFLGFWIWPYYKIVDKQKVAAFRRSLKKKVDGIHKRQLFPSVFENEINSWLGHVRFGQSEHLSKRVLNFLWGRDIEVFKHPNESWRILMLAYVYNYTKQQYR